MELTQRFQSYDGRSSLRIDGRKFGWIGSPSKDSVACAIMGLAGLKTFEEFSSLRRLFAWAQRGRAIQRNCRRC